MIIFLGSFSPFFIETVEKWALILCIWNILNSLKLNRGSYQTTH